MEDFYDVPVTGIMLENGSRISVHYGSTANNRAADAEEANRTAEENGLMLIEPRDFALIVCRQKEIRGMLEKCVDCAEKTFIIKTLLTLFINY